MTEQKRHNRAEEKIVLEKESSNPDFEREFDVHIDLTLGGKHYGFVVYKFFYRIGETRATVLGRYAGDSIGVNDDNERDRITAAYGRSALDLAKKHIQNHHSEVKKIIIQPEELRIGGVYGPEFVAWSKEGTTTHL